MAEATESVSDIVGKAVTFLVVAGVLLGGGYWYVHHERTIPNESSALLGAATRLGVSDQTSMNAFKNAGGLNNQNLWHGFSATSINTVYDNGGKLAMLSLDLKNYAIAEQFAQPSFNNLTTALAEECGASWTQSDMQRNSNMHEAVSPAGTVCEIAETADAVTVTMHTK